METIALFLFGNFELVEANNKGGLYYYCRLYYNCPVRIRFANDRQCFFHEVIPQFRRQRLVWLIVQLENKIIRVIFIMLRNLLPQINESLEVVAVGVGC